MSAPHPSRPSPLLRPHMPELDSLRGVAILLVLFFHGMAPVKNAQLSYAGNMILAVSQRGWSGVNLFFVLSGFLITGILVESRDRRDYYRRFYIRRGLRILPALYATLLLLLVGGWIEWRFLLLSLFFLANSAPLLGVALQYGTLWSLAVEEHFYIVWPTLIRRLSFRRLILIALTIFALTPLCREIAFARARDPQNFFSLYTWFNLDGLALGAFLAIWLRDESFRRKHLSGAAVLLLGSGIALFACISTYASTAAALAATSANLASAGVLSAALLVGAGPMRVLIDRPLLKFFGFISYGLYLVHLLAFRLVEILFSGWLSAMVRSGWPTTAMLLRFLSGCIAAIVIAYLSRRSLEEKFLRKGFASRAAGATPAGGSRPAIPGRS